jgi:uncharacterized protein YkwD
VLAAGCDRDGEAPRRTGSASAGSPAEATLVALEASVFDSINGIRAADGLEPLAYNEEVAAVARAYSCEMARKHFFSHVTPEGEGLADRVDEAGIAYRLVGENIAMTRNVSDPADAAVEGWMESDGHRANILKDDYRQTGVGACQDGSTVYLVQNFLRQ